MKNIIELKGISRTYTNSTQPLTVLKDIDLTIAAGELVAIIGASGSGKSTLMNIMGCLDVPDRGDYYIGGQNAAHLSPDELARLRREHIGFIFQRYHLMPDISALGNVEIPAIYANSRRDQRRLRAAQLLARLGLEGRENHKPGQLSGGQQQRVSIARSLINGGEIILADEPTGALDSKSGQEVLGILSELNQRGHTVVIVTHDMKVAQHAQRIIELQDGEVIADSGCKSPAPPQAPSKTIRARQGYWQSLLDRTRESLQMALKSMNAHRLRTALTMTGIIFGIAAVVTVVALGQGAKQRTLASIRDLGTNVVSIYPGRDFFDDAIDSIRTLVPADADALASQSFVDSVSPEVGTSDSIRFRSKSATASITGVGRDYFRVNGLTLLQGTTFRNDRNALLEVIIDENARNSLFGDFGIEPLGQIVFLGAVPARVVGVVKSNQDSAPNRISVWMPYTTVMYRMVGKTTLSSIGVRLKDNVDNEAAVGAISQLLIQRHGVKDFMLFNRDKFRKSIEHASMTLSLLILMVASISLIIGSLGVMNIMLVSVTERTHEIGVRMAVGARRSDIMQQFMIEAVLVCLIGGALGIALSFAAGSLFTALAGGMLTAIYSWQAAFVAFCCSTLIGMIFGYLPARKAARMDPVNSLASE
ncbi:MULTISPECIES: MacB family efflux pump subunit [unclassified Serratia (in: enterobacteria)]|uniref:MacB family efflux pump subunit n=1 Tax=unclassified Serratia (in: enterobacteria) TaxID=2647522 RepID=UPI002ED2CE5F|nr:MacB family efflux pump subunit [Serratia sp. C2(2)]MEE4447134.1 MacB family efflux pump subunit [Serratia sp. C2(1)]